MLPSGKVRLQFSQFHDRDLWFPDRMRSRRRLAAGRDKQDIMSTALKTMPLMAVVVAAVLAADLPESASSPSAGSGPRHAAGGPYYESDVDLERGEQRALQNTMSTPMKMMHGLLCPVRAALRSLYWCTERVWPSQPSESGYSFMMQEAFPLGSDELPVDVDDYWSYTNMVDDAMWGKNKGRKGGHHGGHHPIDGGGSIEIGGSTPKKCPVISGDSSVNYMKKTYDRWLLTCELESGTEVAHIFQNGFSKHETFKYHADLFPLEKQIKKREKVSEMERTQFPAVPLPKQRTDQDAPLMRSAIRAAPPEGEEPEARQNREAAEAAEDAEDERNMLAWLAEPREAGTTWIEKEKKVTPDRTGDVDKDFPAWKLFKDWIDERIEDKAPSIMMNRLNRWFKCKRMRGESYKKFFDRWFKLRDEVKTDNLYWHMFDDESFQTLLLLQSSDMPTKLYLDIMNDLDLTTVTAVKDKLRFNNFMEAVKRRDTMVNLLQQNNFPAERRGARETPSVRAHFADEVAPNITPAYANYLASNSGWYNPSQSPTQQIMAAAPADPWSSFLVSHFVDAEEDNELIGYLSHGHWGNQQDGKNATCAVFWSEIFGEEIYYDYEVYAYLLKNQCAKCGEIGHWHKDCKNQERNFIGKPNRKPRNLTRMGRQHRAALAEAEAMKAKKGKGFGKGGKKSYAKSAEEEMEFEVELMDDFVEDAHGYATKGDAEADG